jgi:hypothetical protein
MPEKEPLSVTINRIPVDDVWFEGLGPLEVEAIVQEVNQLMAKFSIERGVGFQLFAYTILYYAVQAYIKSNTTVAKTKENDKQLDKAIEKLNNCLQSELKLK